VRGARSSELQLRHPMDGSYQCTVCSSIANQGDPHREPCHLVHMRCQEHDTQRPAVLASLWVLLMLKPMWMHTELDMSVDEKFMYKARTPRRN
jgi:hypothetical protein